MKWNQRWCFLPSNAFHPHTAPTLWCHYTKLTILCLLWKLRILTFFNLIIDVKTRIGKFFTKPYLSPIRPVCLEAQQKSRRDNLPRRLWEFSHLWINFQAEPASEESASAAAVLFPWHLGGLFPRLTIPPWPCLSIPGAACQRTGSFSCLWGTE